MKYHILQRPFLTFHSFLHVAKEARDVEQTVLDLVGLGVCGGLGGPGGSPLCEPWVKVRDLIGISNG